MHPCKIALAAISALAALSATAAFAATTPYDLIRPTWPLSWDSTVFDDFDTTGTKKVGVLNIDKTPASFKAGALMPDTLDQAYLDAINSKISPIRVNQAGYLKSDKERQFYFVGAKATEFEVVDADGKSLSTKVTGTFTNSGTEVATEWTIVAGTDATSAAQKRYTVNFTGPSGKIFVGNIPQSVPTDKRLRIKVGEEISSTFIVSDDVYTMAKDASLKFFGIQRSGNSESWFHGPSHVKDGSGSVVNNITDKDVSNVISPKAGNLQGGWYDCGDHLKESLTQAFAFMSLAVMSASNPTKDVDHYAYNQAEFVKTDGIPDMLREAKHGADFFLRAFRVAKGVIDNMPVSIGNFGADHGWWGRPETQDYVTQERRGGPAERDIRLGELGSNVSAEIAAGLAILGKNYAQYDSVYADSCLMLAKKMYDFAKNLKLGKSKYDGDKSYVNNLEADGWGTDAYIGNDASHDDLAVAAIALHYATYETTKKMDYLNDAVEDSTIGVEQQSGLGFFKGGWMAWNRDGMRKSSRTTGWASTHTYALYAFYKMLLKDSTIAAKYGISDKARINYIENIVSAMAINLAYISGNGNSKIELPVEGLPLWFDDTWYTTLAQSAWVYNHYQIGNIFDVFSYADVVKDIEKQGDALPNIAKTSLKTSEMFQLGTNELNYLFGVNPWDISLVYGVGDKNDAHPHHRAANPEGRSTSGQAYNYQCPVGGLWGGYEPKDTSIIDNEGIKDWEHYYSSETCLNAAALLTSVLTIASNGGSDYYEKKCDNCKTDTPKPFGEDSVYAAAYRYEFGGLETFNTLIYNGSLEELDSVTAYIYFEATEEDVDSCKIIFDEDICMIFDIAGFNKPCPDDKTLRDAFRRSVGVKLDETYDKKKKTYSWVKEIPIGKIDVGNKVRLDITTSSGIKGNGMCETLRTPSGVKIRDGWSFTSHAAEKDAPAYAGAPEWDKDQGDIQDPPKDPYIVIRSKGKLLWGYGPGKATDDRVGFVNVAIAGKARMQVNGNRLFVQATAQGTKTVKLFDMLGNQLMEKTFDGSYADISLAKLPHRGTMVAKLSSNGKSLATQTFKVK